MRQYAQYMGHTARHRSSWPAIAHEARRPRCDEIARIMPRGTGRLTQHLLAEDALANFVVARATREGRQVWDWQAEAADRAMWTDISHASEAHAAQSYFPRR